MKNQDFNDRKKPSSPTNQLPEDSSQPIDLSCPHRKKPDAVKMVGHMAQRGDDHAQTLSNPRSSSSISHHSEPARVTEMPVVCTSDHASPVKSVVPARHDQSTDLIPRPHCSWKFAKTLRVCCKRLDDKACPPSRRRKQQFVLREDHGQTNVTTLPIKVRRTGTEAQNLPKKCTRGPKVARQSANRQTGYSTPLNQRNPDFSEESPAISCACSEVDNPELNRSFQMDVLNMGYSHSPAISRTGHTPATASQAATKSPTSCIPSPMTSQKMFRITAPMYKCSVTKTHESGGVAMRKGNACKRKSAKRRLCSEIGSSPDDGSVLMSGKSLPIEPNVTRKRIAYPGIHPRSYAKHEARAKHQCRADYSTQGMEEIWISPTLQIDTMGCLSTRGITKDYNRAVVVCLYGSSFLPHRAASAYPDALNTRVTYDKDGKVAVIEPKGSLSAGIYRIICTQVACPHTCLQGSLAMETLLVRCSSMASLKPHSQYLVISEMHRVPLRQWRERLSATAVRLHLEDFLHTFSFHKFALPLLLWNGEPDTWYWTREKPVKFQATRKRKISSKKQKSPDDEKKSRTSLILAV